MIKTIDEEQRHRLLKKVVLFLGTLIGLTLGFISPRPEDIFGRNAVPSAPEITSTPTPKPSYKTSPGLNSSSKKQVNRTAKPQIKAPKLPVTGKVSYYSHAGCLGCGKNQVTASGERFDENAMTLAIPHQWRKQIPMGTKVRVTNTDNGRSVTARVNDTGGFLKYGRVADLSLGLMRALEAKTDKSLIVIEQL